MYSLSNLLHSTDFNQTAELLLVSVHTVLDLSVLYRDTSRAEDTYQVHTVVLGNKG